MMNPAPWARCLFLWQTSENLKDTPDRPRFRPGGDRVLEGEGIRTQMLQGVHTRSLLG